MSFLNPLALGLGSLAGLIVLMYLLKLKRKPEKFSSTLLWVKTLQDLTANAPFQKLRQNLLMYLQILLMIALALSLARPTMWMTQRRGVARIVLIDTSASMNATDAEPAASRLEAAKAAARELVDNMTGGDRMMLVTFGGAARVANPFTREKATLRSALRRIEPTDAGSKIHEAILLSQGVRKVEKNAIVTIISDGSVGFLGNVFKEDDPVEYVRVGTSDNNQGIVAFDVRESFEDTGEVQVFVEVENFSASPADVRLVCLIDGEIVQVKDQSLEGKGKQGFVFTGLEGASGRPLRLELHSDDVLDSDDVVEGVLDVDSTIDVLIVTRGNFFLEQVLPLLPGAVVSKIAPEDYTITSDFDLIVFDQFAPPALGQGNYLFLNSVPPIEPFAKGKENLKGQEVVDWHRIHPVTRYAKFEDLFVNEALDLELPDWVVTLAESPQGTLLYSGENKGIRLIGVAFDIYDSDWPLKISFPIFFSNAVRWLAGKTEGSLRGSYRAGETITLPANGELRITGPAGGKWRLEPNDNNVAYFNETYRVGRYEIEHADEDEDEEEHQHGADLSFTVNLLSGEESDIEPRGELISGEQKITAAEPTRENREIWHWFALFGLAVLVTEWHLYCRRAWL